MEHPRDAKKDVGRPARLMRLIAACLDPRAWAHGIKLLNFYNYTHVSELRRIQRSANVRISPTASFANGHNISLGARVRIGAGVHVWAGQTNGQILLGEDVMIGPNVMITAASYDFNDGSPVTEQPMKEADVTIGRDVWLAYGVVVLPGTVIGDGAIVAANTVVRGSVPKNAIVAGNPMELVGTRQTKASD